MHKNAIFMQIGPTEVVHSSFKKNHYLVDELDVYLPLCLSRC